MATNRIKNRKTNCSRTPTNIVPWNKPTVKLFHRNNAVGVVRTVPNPSLESLDAYYDCATSIELPPLLHTSTQSVPVEKSTGTPVQEQEKSADPCR